MSKKSLLVLLSNPLSSFSIAVVKHPAPGEVWSVRGSRLSKLPRRPVVHFPVKWMKASLVLPRLFRSAMTTPRRTSKSRTGVRKAHGEPDAVPSTSASLVILAPLSLSERTEGYDYRLLLLKRHATSTAFVSAHVFPGATSCQCPRAAALWVPFC